MRKTVFIALFIAVAVMMISADAKIQKIAIVNMEKVMETVFSGKSGAVSDLQKEKKDMQQNFFLQF